MNWSTAMSKAEQNFKAADAAFLLKDWKTGILHLTKAQQWLSEVGRLIFEEKQ